MNKIKYIIISFFILTFVSCKAQNSIENKETPQVWYSYNTEGELGSCTFYKDKIVFKSPITSESEKSVSVTYIEKRLNTQHLIVRNDLKKPPYAVIKIEKGASILKMSSVITGSSVSSLEESFKENTPPAWMSLIERHWYTKEKTDRLEKAPGLDELKREDLLTSLQWRPPLSEKLQQYLEDTKNERPFMIYRFVENYRNQKLVELGYNPYKRVIYNLHKKFEDDEEIMKLLNEEIKF
ncbi:hypothetical protein GTQ40_17175 [Flavobacteriaceae bacterium R38]|nr:hypothetical protein [Flavobacteriaceae bacterium R38]